MSQESVRHFNFMNKFNNNRTPSRFSGKGKGIKRFPQRSFKRSPQRGQYIDVSRFVNKVDITEKLEIFAPTHSFNDFNIDIRLKENIKNKKYASPTKIQDGAIEYILKGRDIVGIANTGTGKTGAFLIPLLQKIIADPKQRVLIVAPTRELAIQIDQELISLTRGLNVSSVSCVGGAPIGGQISQLKRYNNFIIGTCGRIKDLMQRNFINLSGFGTIVLDEADRMLDMGFIGDMKFMMAKMPKGRHTLFFTATMSKEIEALIGEFLNNPIIVSVKAGDTPKNIHQDIIKVSGGNKMTALHNLLLGVEFKKVIIFGRTKHGVNRLSKDLVNLGLKAESIHGNKNHSQRQRALGLFKQEKVQILVATDVAARGLDIPDVSHVINYDIPATYDDYVHRIGRTGRGDKRGKALTFVE